MKTMLHKLFEARKAAPVRRKSARLSVETMESRQVPTVVFRPHFGEESIAPGSQNESMQSPPVYVTFWGPYWGTAQGQQDESALLASAQSIINSSYFTGLEQYGSDGIVTFGASWQDFSTPQVDGSGKIEYRYLAQLPAGHHRQPRQPHPAARDALPRPDLCCHHRPSVRYGI